MFYGIYKNEISDFIILGDEKGIKYFKLYSDEEVKELEGKGAVFSNDFFKGIFNQLDEYFLGERQTFDVKLNPEGTEFFKNVWNELLDIPYGETRSYKDIAIKVGNEKASRAIGMANNKNPIVLIVPCHRVIGSNGKLVGYAGGLDIKVKLLELESRFKTK